MPDPRFPDPGTKTALIGHADRIKRLEEAMTRKPKTAAVVPTGGGISGITRCNAYAATSGDSMLFSDWWFEPLGPAEVPGITGSGSSGVIVAETGYYEAHLYLSIGWSVPPSKSVLSASCPAMTATSSNRYPYFPLTIVSGEVRSSFSLGIFPLAAGELLFVGVNNVGSPSGAYVNDFVLDVAKVG